MLSPLLRKAAGDAGFDLQLGTDREWERFGVSGIDGVVWVLPSGTGALLALPPSIAAGEFATITWADVPPPHGTRVVRCATPRELYEAMRRVRVLLAQKPPLPQARFQEKLAAITTTEAEAIVRRRVGQGLFREMLLDYWDGRCAVTGLDVPELLRASHAKPWSASTEEERLDPYNGVLLAVHLDLLFDRGLMTFDDEGKAVLSELLSSEARALLTPGPMRLQRVTPQHLAYLSYHRANVFRRSTGVVITTP